MWKEKWINRLLPSSASFQAIIISLTLIFGGIFDILVGHILDFLNKSIKSIIPFIAYWGQAWCYIHEVEGVQEWALVLEFIVMSGIAATIWYLINKANINQRKHDSLMKLDTQQLFSNDDIIRAINELPKNIALELKRLEAENKNDRKKKNS